MFFKGYKPNRPSKFGAEKTIYNNRKYDSKGEAALAQQIDWLIKAKEVLEVKPQVTYELFGKNGSKICSHKVDFLLTFKDKHQELWEYKGKQTRDYIIKLKLFKDNYPELIYRIKTKNDI